MFTNPPASSCWVLLKHFAFLMVLAGAATTANAQLLYSFESDDEGFIEGTFDNSGYISHNQFAGNATDGTGSLQVEIEGTGFGRHVEVDESNNGIDPKTANYDLFNTVAANPSAYNFDFDVTLDAGSWSGLSDVGTYFHVNLFSNSDANFTDQFGIIDIPSNSVGTFSASIPATSLSLGVDSDYFQLLFGNNGNATPGGGGEGLIWYLDNVRFSEVPQLNEQLLFSFETPDDAGTPGVNEQFEGWEDGFNPVAHVRTIAAGPEGVTDGSSALAVTATEAGFTWGSQFELDADVDAGLQGQVDSFISDFNSADRLAIDVTFPDDQFPADPTFLTIGASLSDADGTFYQEFQQAGNPSSAAGSTVTLFFDTDQFVDGDTNEILSVDGLDAGTFFRLALATNSNDEIDFFIDNIRLLSEPVDGDYNGNGTVDAADYTVWRDNVGAPAGTLPNDSAGGVIGIAQYNLWVANFGNPSSSSATSSAIPEPSTALLGVLTCLTVMGYGRRKE